MLGKEREVVGFYISGHPLSKYEIEYKSFATIRLGETEALEESDQSVYACGVINDLRTKIDRAGKDMAFFKLDDFSGSCECLMFSKVYEKCYKSLSEENVVFVVGKLESSGDAIKLQVENLLSMEAAREELVQSVKIFIDRGKNIAEEIIQLKKILNKYEGTLPVYIHLNGNGSKPKLFSLPEYRAKVSEGFIKDVITLLGEDSISLLRK